MLAGLFLFPDAVKRLFFTPHEAVAAERAYRLWSKEYADGARDRFYKERL